ncbi:MAG TPA: histidinol-phosphate transaminase, partial [Vampirovibrionales bacterium]
MNKENYIQLKESLNYLKAYVPGKSIEDIANEYSLSPENIIKLGSNENPLGASPLAHKAVQNFLSAANSQKHLSFYPDGLSESLVDAICKHYPEIGAKNGEASVVAGNGMDNILEGLARLALEPGAQALIHTPTFSYYEIVTKWANAEAIFIETTAENNFELDIEEYINKLSSKVRLAFLCCPNNPSGNVLSWSQIQKVLEAAQENNTIVFLDEAYAEYSEVSYLDKVKDWPNLIIGRTFSKLYGLASLRVGWGVMHKTLIEKYRKVQTPFNVNKLGMLAAAASLTDKEFQKQSLEVNKQGLEYLSTELNSLGFKVFPSKANFLAFLAGPLFDNSAEVLC